MSAFQVAGMEFALSFWYRCPKQLHRHEQEEQSIRKACRPTGQEEQGTECRFGEVGWGEAGYEGCRSPQEIGASQTGGVKSRPGQSNRRRPSAGPGARTGGDYDYGAGRCRLRQSSLYPR